MMEQDINDIHWCIYTDFRDDALRLRYSPEYAESAGHAAAGEWLKYHAELDITDRGKDMLFQKDIYGACLDHRERERERERDGTVRASGVA